MRVLSAEASAVYVAAAVLLRDRLGVSVPIVELLQSLTAARLVVVPGMGHDIDHTHDAWSRLWPDLVTFLNDGVTIGRPRPYQP